MEDESDGTRACSGASRTCPCALTACMACFWACLGVCRLASVVLVSGQGRYRRAGGSVGKLVDMEKGTREGWSGGVA